MISFITGLGKDQELIKTQWWVTSLDFPYQLYDLNRLSYSYDHPAAELPENLLITQDNTKAETPWVWVSAFSSGAATWLSSAQVARSSEVIKLNNVYEVGELFELGIQLSYLLLLLGLLGAGTFFVIRQVIVRRELDLSAKELQVKALIYKYH